MDIRFPKTTTEQLNKFISSRQELYKQYLPTFEKRLHAYENEFGVWYYVLDKEELR